MITLVIPNTYINVSQHVRKFFGYQLVSKV